MSSPQRFGVVNVSCVPGRPDHELRKHEAGNLVTYEDYVALELKLEAVQTTLAAVRAARVEELAAELMTPREREGDGRG